MRHSVLIVSAMVGVCGAARAGDVAQFRFFPGSAGISGEVVNIATFDIGQGPQLGIVGEFNASGGVTTRKVADFDGEVFDNLGSGVNVGVGGAHTRDAIAFQGALYVGGQFGDIGNACCNLAYWDGVNWNTVGNQRYAVALAVMHTMGPNGTLFSGNDVGGWQSWDGQVRTLDVLPQLQNGEIEDAVAFDDGSGEALYAVGSFRTSEGVPMRRFAKWKPGDAGWTQVDGGVGGGPGPNVVYDIDAHDGALYLAGLFDTAGGEPSGGIASWDGENWTHYGQVDGVVHDVEWFDAGDGLALYAGGLFTSIDGVGMSNLARWKGGAWEPVGAGTNDVVYELHVADLGDGPVLFIGGDFTTLDGESSSRFGALRGFAPSCPGDTNGDNLVDFQDLNAVISAFNTAAPDPGYNAGADTNGDGAVDFADLNLVVSRFNLSC